jgi:hypothetical protein
MVTQGDRLCSNPGSSAYSQDYFTSLCLGFLTIKWDNNVTHWIVIQSKYSKVRKKIAPGRGKCYSSVDESKSLMFSELHPTENCF